MTVWENDDVKSEVSKQGYQGSVVDA
jgi:hypothetical protein